LAFAFVAFEGREQVDQRLGFAMIGLTQVGDLAQELLDGASPHATTRPRQLAQVRNSRQKSPLTNGVLIVEKR
jgi:hypothetical protein